MTTALKKSLVILPVALLGCFYLYDHTGWYRNVSGKRLLFLGLSFFILYAWVFLEALRRRQNSFSQIAVQGSFFVYVFMVLTLTGYFILFREISAHDWYEKMMLRIEKEDRVNFELFKIFSIYKMSSMQIVGNLVMLMPLGIYLPLLYRNTAHFFLVLFISLAVSCLIEFLQLVTSFRSADIDDVLLNTLGACAGFVIYSLFRLLIPKKTAMGAAPVTVKAGSLA